MLLIDHRVHCGAHRPEDGLNEGEGSLVYWEQAMVRATVFRKESSLRLRTKIGL
jgi:hypothetical protein